MSEDALSRAMRINGLLAERQKKVAGESSNNPLRVVELFGANPFITIKGVADKLAIAFTTAERAIERLERARIVKRIGDAKRDRVYCRDCSPGYPRRAGPPQACCQQVTLSALKPRTLECVPQEWKPSEQSLGAGLRVTSRSPTSPST